MFTGLKRRKSQKQERDKTGDIKKVANKLRKLTIEAEEIKKSRKILKGLEETQQQHARIKWKKAQKLKRSQKGKKELESRYRIEESEILKVDNKLRKRSIESEESKKCRKI